jgi:hypothetical protein
LSGPDMVAPRALGRFSLATVACNPVSAKCRRLLSWYGPAMERCHRGSVPTLRRLNAMTAEEKYVDKARTCVATAQWFNDPAERVAMLCIAHDYLSLAHFIEARNKNPQDKAAEESLKRAA